MAFALVVAVVFAVGLPVAADTLSSTTVPLGAVSVGQASLVPEPGWELLPSATSSNLVTLTKDGAVLSMRTVPVTTGQSPESLLDEMLATKDDFRPVLDPTAFYLPSRDPAVFVPASNSSQSGYFMAATKSDQRLAAQVIGVGSLSMSEEISAEIITMMQTVRLRAR